jgi:two-component system nitrogen regulation response regulator GlnG
VRELENLIRRLAVLHSGETIPSSAISAELKEPVRLSDAEVGDEAASLSEAVERHLTTYFLAQGDKLPPPGLYDRIVREIERPLLSICLGATRGKSDSCGASAGAQPEHPAQEDQGSRPRGHQGTEDRSALIP